MSINKEELLPFCECGKCGLRVTKPGNRFIHGHQRRGKHHTDKTKLQISETLKNTPKPPNSLEHNAAISKAKTGVPMSDDAKVNMSTAHKGIPLTEAAKATLSETHKKHPEIWEENYKNMSGGNDTVKHHHIYDHNDLSKYTIEMTRSKHGKLHVSMYLLGLKIPHINTGYETEDELKLMEYIKKIEEE